MKSIFIIFIMSIATLLQAQQQLALSLTPTHSELKKIFKETGRGGYTSIEVLSKIVERKDKAVSALQSYLNAQTNKDSVNEMEPDRLYAVLALEAIGTKTAYAVLALAALNHPESEVQGTSLKALSGSYYSKVAEDSLISDKEIVHLLLRKCDDTTYVEFCHKRIGEIARDGIKNWMGVDYGDLSLTQTTVKVGKDKIEMTMPQYREWWWTNYNTKLMWNKEKAVYVINP